MDATVLFGNGYALDAMDPAFVLHHLPSVLAFKLENYFFIAANFGLTGIQNFQFPTLGLSEARVHPVKIGRKQRGFFAAGAAADLHYQSFGAGWFAFGINNFGQLFFQQFFAEFELIDLNFGQGQQFRIFF